MAAIVGLRARRASRPPAARRRRARSSLPPTTTRRSRPSSPGTPRPSRARREACLARGAKRAIPLAGLGAVPLRADVAGAGKDAPAPRARRPSRGAALPVVTNVDAAPESDGARLARRARAPDRLARCAGSSPCSGWRARASTARSRSGRATCSRASCGASTSSIKVEGHAGDGAPAAPRARARRRARRRLRDARSRPGPAPPAAFDAAVVAARAPLPVPRSASSARHLESGRTYEHNGDRRVRVRLGHQDRRPDGGDGRGSGTGRSTSPERWDADGGEQGRRLRDAPDARPRPESDVERPDDADDRPVRQHRDQRLDRRASESSAINARMESLGLRAHPALRHDPAGCSAQRRRAFAAGRASGSGSSRRDEVARVDGARRARGAPRRRSPRSASSTISTRTRAACGSRGGSRPSDLWAGQDRDRCRGVRNDSGHPAHEEGPVRPRRPDRREQGRGLGPDHPAVLAIADLAKAIVDGWSADLPDIVEKPE